MVFICSRLLCAGFAEWFSILIHSSTASIMKFHLWTFRNLLEERKMIIYAWKLRRQICYLFAVFFSNAEKTQRHHTYLKINCIINSTTILLEDAGNEQNEKKDQETLFDLFRCNNNLPTWIESNWTNNLLLYGNSAK